MEERRDRAYTGGSGREGGKDAAAAERLAAAVAARRLEAAVPRDVESGDPRDFEAAADQVLPALRAALEAGMAADPALLAAARIAAYRALHGDADGAVGLLEPAAALAEEAELQDPFLAAVLAEQLASALQDVGRDEAAVAAAGRAEALGRRVCRPGDPRLATLLANVGTVHKRRGDFVTAEVHFRRALEELDRWKGTPGGRGDGGPAEGAARAALAAPICLSLCDALRAQGKPEEAVPLAERAARETEAALGPMHAATADALEMLALVLDDVGEAKEARSRWSRLAALRELHLGEGHPLTRAARARSRR